MKPIESETTVCPHAPRFRRAGTAVASTAALMATAFAISFPVHAHPHAWVKSKSAVIYDNGTVKALRHTWVFDAYYTNGATEGLDKNGDGKFDRAELEELTKINIEGLKEFDYFTDAKLGGKAIKFATPTEASMEIVELSETDAPKNGSAEAADTSADSPDAGTASNAGTEPPKAAKAGEKVKLLSLTFTLPLAQPILATAKDFEFAVRDPSIFIWFELMDSDPVQLVGAPAGCTHTLGAPTMTEEQKRLDAAFGGVGGLSSMMSAVKAVKLSCPAS